MTKSTVLVDLNTRNTRKVGNLTKERKNHACALFKNNVYLVASGETEIFDLGTEKWTSGQTLPGQISGSGSLAEYQNELFYSDEDNFYKLGNEGWKPIYEVKNVKSRKNYTPLSIVVLDSNSHDDNPCVFV